jgi:hypothetical protein
MTIAERELEQPLEHEIDPALQRELLKHPGEWVAVTRSELIASSTEVAEVFRLAAERGVASPIVFQVPRDDGTAYFF